MPVFASAYFPPLAYVAQLLSNPEVILDLKEHFVKQSVRTRAELLAANGVVQINVPIVHLSGQKQCMEQIRIDYSSNWQAEHWRTIESAYSNAPYFEHYALDIRQIYAQKHAYLHELNSAILTWVNTCLGLDLSIQISDAYTGQTPSEKKMWLGRTLQPTTPYQQVFLDKANFVANLSVLDGLMNEGPLLRTRF